MDGEADDAAAENQPTKKVPTAPNAFIGQMASSAFTHRNDAKDVVHLQEKIFHEKVTARKRLELSHLTQDHMMELTGSLPHYRSLRVLEIRVFSASEEQVIAFVQADPPFTSLCWEPWVVQSVFVVDAQEQHFAWQALSSLPLEKLVLYELEGPAGTGDALAQAMVTGTPFEAISVDRFGRLRSTRASKSWSSAGVR